MEWMHVIVLSLIQGFSEFLPISSSAHLILPSQLFGWPDQGLAFDVAVHVGTLLAVIIAFRHDVIAILSGWFAQVFKRRPSEEARMGWCVLLGTLPALFFGFFLEGIIESYARSALVIAATTILFGLLLWWADKRGRRERDMQSLGLRDALLIGVAQALALIPGTSRSGITITAALMMGFTRQAAARFSFLLSIPLIVAAGSLKGLQLVESGTDVLWGDILAGVGLSFVSALICIKLFLAALDRIGMLPFVIYRLILGAVLLVAFL
ncbi:undecaprenyl-diphosphate phosphatase [Larsenimonas rhizosphaerae]|uniref:Undecaprenyl-diphosphatase n=1 Tax=Larsenimonas rhizosphaerae TaxID=2944682 RepID=A0AA41ZJB1_9GAMM|nr:undecaprenyl-diphosphate phosphatase [Larsenimonas rhizosphaerae]MCM2130134.1 undecaprenyl-diphosphate phosphatase [Larsenimonas rhizosphaerae]MCX2522821.1 undecaprenyl-diphosphate phosphatase [Larsenimonas rhizosphaerae]